MSHRLTLAIAPTAAEVFTHATKLLHGADPRQLTAQAEARVLHRNRIAQILCACQAMAASAALRDAWPNRLMLAGYSVGEVAAWGVPGLMSAVESRDGRKSWTAPVHRATDRFRYADSAGK